MGHNQSKDSNMAIRLWEIYAKTCENFNGKILTKIKMTKIYMREKPKELSW